MRGGFAFFGLNFDEEAGAATEVLILRACIVQGSQQSGLRRCGTGAVSRITCYLERSPLEDRLHHLAACGHVLAVRVPFVAWTSGSVHPEPVEGL